MPLQRKKWTEEEERALMDKYAEMASDGSLARMRTREKKFRPIAAHVNAAHHAVHPGTYPHLWSWKDASTKVQNMRHQYLLVKQKLFSAFPSPSDCVHRIDWADGLNLWPNFLRYREVFGDAPLPPPKPTDQDPPPPPPFPVAAAAAAAAAAAGDIDGDDGDLGLGLGFDCCGGEEVEEEGFDYEEVAPPVPSRAQAQAARKRRRKRRRPERRRAWEAVAGQLERLAEREARLEEREAERERERRRRREEALDAEEEAARRRREEEREWEERMEGRRAEWRKRAEEMLGQHRAEMEQIQARILHDQQSIVNQLLGFLSHWAASPVITGGLADAAMGSHHQHQPHHHQQQHHQHYLSQMLQGLHHVNGIVPGDNRVGGDSQEDQFIVDE